MPVVTPPTYATLSAMITPALFLTANGSLIISTSNRMARIADRIRALGEGLDRLGRDPGDLDYVPDRIDLLDEMLCRMDRRSDDVRAALTLLYLAFFTFACTSLTLGMDVLLGNRIAALPTILAIGGVCLMLLACLRLVREAFAALRGNDREVQFYRDLHARRKAAKEARG